MNNLKFEHVVELLDYETMPYKNLIKWKKRLHKLLKYVSQYDGDPVFEKPEEKERLSEEMVKVRTEIKRRRDKEREMVEEVLIPDLANVVMGYMHRQG